MQKVGMSLKTFNSDKNYTGKYKLGHLSPSELAVLLLPNVLAMHSLGTFTCDTHSLHVQNIYPFK